MESKAIAASLFRENLLPLTLQDTPAQTPVVSLESVMVTDTTGFVCLVDAISKIYSARAPRLPALKRDSILYGP
jgi:hypothetical protein